MNVHEELIKSIEQSCAIIERHTYSERTKAGMREAVLNGRCLHRTFGYTFENNAVGKRQLFPDRNAEYVKLIFTLASEGKKVREISAVLKSKNVSLSMSQISRIIKNPVYCGLLRYEDKLIKAIHEPLISEELFNAVQ